MIEPIGATYMFFGKVKYFTYKRESERVKELIVVNWDNLPGD